ncbi:MAG: hypothetical protein OCD03_08885 [Hyphomicrobiales bacterium]
MAKIIDKTLLKNPIAIVFGLGVFVSMLAYYIYDIELAYHLHGIFLGLFLLTLAYVYFKRNKIEATENSQSKFAKFIPLLFVVIGVASVFSGASQILS